MLKNTMKIVEQNIGACDDDYLNNRNEKFHNTVECPIRDVRQRYRQLNTVTFVTITAGGSNWTVVKIWKMCCILANHHT